jgi:hypothetical protein
LRETYKCGLSDLGDAVTWGEAKILIEDAASDPSTSLGAELAGWAYPASMLDILSLAAQIGNRKVTAKLMPWALDGGRKQKSTPDEVAAAQAALDADFIFT